MMSFEECQEMGRKIRKNIEESETNIRKTEEERLKGLGITQNKIPQPRYEHPSMPGGGTMTILFIIGYIVCLLFKGWWVGWILLSSALGKYLTRYDKEN